MKIQQWLFKILRKQNVTDGRTHGRTDRRTDGQHENSIPTTNKVCGGYNDIYGSNINIHQIQRERFKTEDKAQGFLPLIRGTWQMLMHWKTMFDHYYCINSMIYKNYKMYVTILSRCFLIKRWLAVFINISVPKPNHLWGINGPAVVKCSVPEWVYLMYQISTLTQWFIYNFGLMGPGTRCFQYQWVPTANLWVQNTIFNDKSAILLHPRTPWDSLK